ncbi:PAS domain-containing protein [Oerskovia sp. M15]
MYDPGCHGITSGQARTTAHLARRRGAPCRPQPAMVDLMDELSSTMFCAKDVTGRYVLVNRVFVARTNERSRRAVVGRRATDLFVPQLAERYDQQDAEVLRTGRPLRNELELIRRLGGTPGGSSRPSSRCTTAQVTSSGWSRSRRTCARTTPTTRRWTRSRDSSPGSRNASARH